MQTNKIALFDAHAHYDDERFGCEWDGGGDGAILAAREAGICGIINVGSNVQTSKNSVALATRYDFIRAAVGIHPSDAQRIPKGEEAAALSEIERLLKHSRVVALGEIGLDYHYDDTDKAVQQAFFDAELSLAEKARIPVIIHDRDAHGDIFDTLCRHREAFGVIHSYSGSAEMARQLVNMGWYLSFSGPLTYKNAVKVRESAAAVPRNRVLVETDAPYLPPVPHRGKINYSGYLHHTAEALAAVWKISLAECAAITIENTRRLFRIEPVETL